MATTVASLEVDLLLNDQVTSSLTKISTGLDNVGGKFQSVGGKMQRIGRNMTLAMLPVTAGFAVAIKKSTAFNKAMTNAGTILGKTADEMEEINAQVLALGADSIAGPQAAAEAFFDIVSGVEDATTHMAILEESIKTAEAGQADLGSTTSVLVGIMNAYGLEASQATVASDILTQTVNSGVLTMDELAAALPKVTSLASQFGISFEEVAGSVALITKTGTSATKATTQLQAAISAIIKPNELMKEALAEMGFASGEAALETLGLQGVLQALGETDVVKNNSLAAVVGSVEGLNAALVIGNEEAGAWLLNFRGIPTAAQEAEAELRVLTGEADNVAEALDQMGVGFENATEKAQAIQNASPAAQFALLTSNIDAVAIKIGDVLLPAFVSLSEDLIPIVDNIATWIEENPELTQQLLVMAGALIILGPLLGIAGTALTLIGTGMTVISGVLPLLSKGFGLLLPMITPLLIPLALFAAALSIVWNWADKVAKVLGFEGITDLLGKSIDIWTENFNNLGIIIELFWNGFADWAKTAIDNVVGWVGGLITIVDDAISKLLTMIGLGGDGGQSGATNLETQQAAAGGSGEAALALVTGGQGARTAGGSNAGGVLGFFGLANATGGPMSGGETSLVGERGPELFTAPTSGRIIPNNVLRSPGGAGGERIIHIENVFVQGFQDIPTLVDQIEIETAGRGASVFVSN